MTDKNNKAGNSPLKEALLQMADLCARSEQCAFDIDRKLRLKGFSSEESERVIAELTRRNFLDSGRYARSFANDKIRFAGWGRVKIRLALLQRRVPEIDIRQALENIDRSEYHQKLISIARLKSRRFDLNSYGDRMKLIRHLVIRGFTASEASSVLKEIRDEDS